LATSQTPTIAGVMTILCTHLPASDVEHPAAAAQQVAAERVDQVAPERSGARAVAYCGAPAAPVAPARRVHGHDISRVGEAAGGALEAAAGAAPVATEGCLRAVLRLLWLLM
jgi:hypothetical protein